MSDATTQDIRPNADSQVLDRSTELELTESVEKDRKGVSYIMNLIAMYGLFFVFMLVIAWFGIFSEV